MPNCDWIEHREGPPQFRFPAWAEGQQEWAGPGPTKAISYFLTARHFLSVPKGVHLALGCSALTDKSNTIWLGKPHDWLH